MVPDFEHLAVVALDQQRVDLRDLSEIETPSWPPANVLAVFRDHAKEIAEFATATTTVTDDKRKHFDAIVTVVDTMADVGRPFRFLAQAVRPSVQASLLLFEAWTRSQ